MKREENRIDQVFRGASEAFGVEAPTRAWDRIAVGLDQAVRMRRIVWYRRTAAAAAVLLAFFIGYYFPGKQEKVVYVQNEPAPLSRVVSSTPSTDNMSIQQTESLPDPQTQTSRPIPENRTIRSSAVPELLPYYPETRDVVPVLAMISDTGVSTTGPVSSPKRDGVQSLSAGNSMKPDSLRGPVSPELLPSLLPPTAPLAEGNSRDGARRVNWRIGGDASPTYAYRSLDNTPAEFSVMADNATEEIDKKEMPILAYSVGISTSMDFGSRLSFQSGIRYARMGQSTEQPLVQYRFGSGSKAFTSAGMIVFNDEGSNELSNKTFLSSDPHYSGSLVQQFDYLEIPLVASVRVIDKSFGLSVFAGMSAGVLVGNNAYFIDESGNKLLAGYTYDLNRFVYGGLAGIGMEYPLLNRLSLSVAPGFKYSFSELNDYSTIGNHPYSFTLSTGINYRFGSD